MDTDPPADDLAAVIGYGNEVAGLNNDGGKASGEELNEDGGEASGEEASLPKPKKNRIYNTFVCRKRKRCLSRHKNGQQKQTTYDFSASRAAIGIPNANSQKIASTLVGDHQLRYSHQSHSHSQLQPQERQGRRLAYQSQRKIGYTTHLDLEKGRDASSGKIRGNKNKQHMTSQPAGLLLVFLMPIPRRLLLPLWVTTN